MIKIFHKLSNHYFSKQTTPYWIILLLDCCIVMMARYIIAYQQYGGYGFAQHFWPVTYGMLLCLVIFIISFRLFHTYSGVVRFTTIVDLHRVVIANFLASVLVWILTFIYNHTGIQTQYILFPNLNCIIQVFIISSLFMGLLRVGVKNLYDSFRERKAVNKAVIYGVHGGAEALARSIISTENSEYTLAGFISPDGYLVGKYLMGAQVFDDKPGVLEKVKKIGTTAIIVSPLQFDYFRTQDELINDAIQSGFRILMINEAQQWDGKSELGQQRFKEVDIEDLLPRQQIHIDMTAIAATLKNKCILITGAAGSIGSEIVRQVAQFIPSQLVLVDQAETPMHDIRLMMARDFSDIKAETIVASITNKDYMEQLFDEFRPEYVFHAAAYKHVPMMEDNPAIAVQNNVVGTHIIADLAVKYGTKKFVMISTDKAVNPTNVMGCSKRICEIYCQSLNKAIQEGILKPSENLKRPETEWHPVTQFVTTRFGNVLGSNGSVIPLFREQIKKGGPVTVTDPNIIRYFMLIPEACKLVLEAATIGKGGEIFVFDMGNPVKISDLAKRMIALSGATAVKIEYTGLRDGEKLYEEVLSDKEKTKPTSNSKIFVANVREYEYQMALENEEKLLEISHSNDKLAIVRKMQEIVPEYNSTNQAYA